MPFLITLIRQIAIALLPDLAEMAVEALKDMSKEKTNEVSADSVKKLEESKQEFTERLQHKVKTGSRKPR